MGRASKKKGAQRKDVFYHRAKESGYRARSAFKIIQLDRKYNLFQNARVCIDLCAAPGSWMQVASKYMPVSSVIIGVDRFPIANIPNTVCIQGDITTERVRQDIKSNLKNWKADIVLHDGAPNVGRSWLHDAYQQNLLVLHSFKLACEFLNKGGSFVTKVFRSRDHLSLQYIFKKLFRKVEATKPVASRFESAEIFVVCKGFLAPDKVDPEFFDPKHVFQPFEEPASKTGLHLRKPEMTKKKAIGYEEGVTMLFKKRNISTFIKSKTFLDILADTNQFEWDLPSARNSIHTTDEILISCQDLKVIGKREIRNLLSWRKLVRKEYLKAKRENKLEYTGEEVEEEDDDDDEEDKDDDLNEVEKDKTGDKITSDDEEKNEAEKELDELSEIQRQIMELKMAKEKQDKQKQRAKDKVKRKQMEKMKLQLMVPGDEGPKEVDVANLFTLNTLSNVSNIDKIADQTTDILMDPEPEEQITKPTKNRAYYSKEGARLDSTGTYFKTAEDSSSESETDEEEHDSDADKGLRIEKEEKKAMKKKKKRVSFADEQFDNDGLEDEEEEKDSDWKWNPLVTDLVGDDLQEIRERKAERWFSKSLFENMETEDMEDYELESAIEKHKKAGGELISKKPEPDKDESPVPAANSKKSQDYLAKDAPESDSDFDSDSDTDSDSGVDSDKERTMMEKKEEEKEASKKRKRKGLDPVGLALATKMIRSKKAMRDVYDEGWNRYMFDDPNAPEWFLEEERKFNTPRVEVDKEDLRMYRDRDKAVDSRTIKKVTEAKARKQRRRKKRLLKVKKKAETLVSNMDMTAREKSVEINKLYKKATITKPKEKNYFVMKRGYKGLRPKGAKGTIVDRRMKKDKLAKQKLLKKRGPRINKKPQRKIRDD